MSGRKQNGERYPHISFQTPIRSKFNTFNRWTYEKYISNYLVVIKKIFSDNVNTDMIDTLLLVKKIFSEGRYTDSYLDAIKWYLKWIRKMVEYKGKFF